MKQKFCVRSMGLGAVIMLIGLVVGAIVSPPLIAQSNAVFHKVVCGSNANAVLLGSTDESNYVSVSDKQGKETVTLRSAVFVGNSVTVYDNQGKESVVLSGTAAHNSLNVFNKKSGIPGINILSGEGANGVAILDQQGEIVIVLASNDKKNRVVVIDKTGKEMSLGD